MALFDRFFKRGSEAETRSMEDRGIPNNPSGMDFLNSAKYSISKAVDKHSITTHAIVSGLNYARGGNPFGASGALVANSDVDTMYGKGELSKSIPVDTNKIARIQSYDNIARYPELDWCINEIANDFLHPDIDGDYMKLKFECSNDQFTNGEDTILQEEFKHLTSLYDLKTNGFNMIRKFLIEGELCFENVINPEHTDYGIIGFKYIPTMFYDFLRNRDTGQIVGIFIDPERIKTYTQFSTFAGNGYAGQNSQIFNATRTVPAYSYTYTLDMKNKITMPFEQVTYMNSGILSEDSAIVFPAIDKVVVPVRQLLLMHDALVIYRITRAPEKLAFNIDLAGMPSKKAKEIVRQISMQHKTRKAVQGSGAVTNVYNAETMLDAYYFWKTGEGTGTTVTPLNSTSHYNELHDVEYFLKRILKFLNIPWQRWAESAANRQDRQSIQNEEYSFAQSIVRYQTMFAAAVKKTFITHLRLKGLFDKFDLHESDITVEMIPPAIFDLYQAQQRFNDVLDILVKVSSMDFISKNLILKKLLNMTDDEIKENELEVRREKLLNAQTEFAVQQIAGGNPKIYLDVDKYFTQQPQQQQPQPPPDGGQPPPPDGGQPPQQPSGEEEQKANDGFAEFANSPNINVSLAPSATGMAEEVDDSGKTVAQRDMPENPEFGDYAAAAKTERPIDNKVYPETKHGVDNMDVADKSTEKPMSLSAVFDNAFNGIKSDKSSTNSLQSSLSDIFNRKFGKKSDVSKETKASNGSGSLSSTFDDYFKYKSDIKHGDLKKLSLHDTFKTAIKNASKAKTRKRVDDEGEVDNTLSGVMDDMFGNIKR